MISQTQIQKVRSKMKANRVYINKELQFSDADVFEMIVAGGCNFLAKIYGLDSAPYLKHSRSKQFWNWYRLQWSGVEESFVHYLQKTSKHRPHPMLVYQYSNWMNFYCITSERIDQAFKNYLKSI